ncbi:hypothetical protein Q9233_008953 [Columba guinea]|nr:hypothetical protein Q9233_008953 [Columba guinea]
MGKKTELIEAENATIITTQVTTTHYIIDGYTFKINTPSVAMIRLKFDGASHPRDLMAHPGEGICMPWVPMHTGPLRGSLHSMCDIWDNSNRRRNHLHSFSGECDAAMHNDTCCLVGE